MAPKTEVELVKKMQESQLAVMNFINDHENEETKKILIGVCVAEYVANIAAIIAYWIEDEREYLERIRNLLPLSVTEFREIYRTENVAKD